MEITTDLVKHLANLSRLNFSEEEIVNFKEEFTKTLQQIDELQSVNTENIITNAKVVNAKDLREDEIKESLSTEEVIFNAAKKSRGAIIVPKAID